MFFQNVVCTASNNDAVGLSGHFSNNTRLFLIDRHRLLKSRFTDG